MMGPGFASGTMARLVSVVLVAVVAASAIAAITGFFVGRGMAVCP